MPTATESAIPAFVINSLAAPVKVAIAGLVVVGEAEVFNEPVVATAAAVFSSSGVVV